MLTVIMLNVAKLSVAVPYIALGKHYGTRHYDRALLY